MVYSIESYDLLQLIADVGGFALGLFIIGFLLTDAIGRMNLEATIVSAVFKHQPPKSK